MACFIGPSTKIWRFFSGWANSLGTTKPEQVSRLLVLGTTCACYNIMFCTTKDNTQARKPGMKRLKEWFWGFRWISHNNALPVPLILALDILKGPKGLRPFYIPFGNEQTI